MQAPTGGDLFEVTVVVPTDVALRRRIHRTIEFVVKHGAEFEVHQWPPPADARSCQGAHAVKRGVLFAALCRRR